MKRASVGWAVPTITNLPRTKFVVGTGHPAGLTLLEVVLALTIFCGSLAVLSQMAWNGTRAAVQGRLQTQAVVRCEAILNEIVVGALPMQATAGQPCSDDSHWTWSVNLGQTKFPELIVVEVTVSHTGGSSMANVHQTLRRWMRDPAVYEAALMAKEAEQSQSSSSSSSGTSGTSGSSSSGSSK